MDSDHWSEKDDQRLTPLRKAPLSTKEDDNLSCDGKGYAVYPVSPKSLATVYDHYRNSERSTLPTHTTDTHTRLNTDTHSHHTTTDTQTSVPRRLSP